MPWRARPRSRVRASPGLASRSTLLTIAPATWTPCRSNSAALSTISSIGRPTPPSDTMTAGAPSIARDDRVRQPDDRADAGVPGALDEQHVAVGRERGVGGPDPRRQVLDDLALDVGLGEAARDVDRAHLRRAARAAPKTLFIRTASSSAGTPSSMTVRWPTGFMNPVDRPRRWNPSRPRG